MLSSEIVYTGHNSWASRKGFACVAARLFDNGPDSSHDARPMEPEILHYEKIVEEALRSVVRTALVQVATYGLPGDHSLYISFLTRYPGVDIPDRLIADYPEDMTIVLEHQFWDLEVHDDHFGVTLSFNRRKERLIVPFSAVNSFADPSVPFGLKFELATVMAGSEASEAEASHPSVPDAAINETDADIAAEEDEAARTGEVVNLDSFRKKR
jgi:hypothetical protein